MGVRLRVIEQGRGNEYTRRFAGAEWPFKQVLGREDWFDET
jgi:hypothetical protein